MTMVVVTVAVTVVEMVTVEACAEATVIDGWYLGCSGWQQSW